MRWLKYWVWLGLIAGCHDDTANAGGGTDSDGSTTSDGLSPTTATTDVDPSDPGTTLTTTDSDTDGTDTDDPSATGGAVCPPPEEDTPGPTECTRDCGANAFDLEHISGINYSGVLVHDLFPACEGPSCPEPSDAGTYRDQAITPCEDSPAAQASARGPEAYCRLSPLALVFGFELGFTESPSPESITEYRPLLDGDGEEAYVWHDGIVRVEGPTSRYAGRWVRGTGEAWDEVVGRNLTCVENLDALGIPHDRDSLDAACAATRELDGETVPLRMDPAGVFEPTRGRLDGRTSSCSTPGEGPDTCCSVCDEQLSVRVARYGVGQDGTRLSPNEGTAITCDPAADRFESCRDFVADVERRDELVAYRYTWDGCTTDWPLPFEDRLRETHPNARPSGSDLVGGACSRRSDCGDGQECIGTDGAGDACTDGEDCVDRQCRLEWFGQCEMTEAGDHYCVDRRFHLRNASACFVAEQDFEGVDGPNVAGERLAECAESVVGDPTPETCCQDVLGNEAACDPFFQTEVRPVSIFDRTLDFGVPNCVCDSMQSAFCQGLTEELCAPPVGAGTDPAGGALPGTYAYREVRRRGGTRYDEALDGFELRLAWEGYEQRGLTERCAEESGLLSGRSPDEVWSAHTSFNPSDERDYNVAMCSGSTYTLVFGGPDDVEHVRTADGDTLAGKQRYVVQTSDFVVDPGSGFPADNLLISACDAVSLRVSNVFDLSLDNLRKPALWRVEQIAGENVATERVAGGRDCDPDATAGDVAMGAIPCLLVDPDEAFSGTVSVRLDPEQFPNLLLEGQRYRLVLPGLDDSADIVDADAYSEAFHDACGMPLITGDLPVPEYEYEFTVDTPCGAP